MKTEKSKIFGKELVLDLYDCDFKIISSKEKIKEFSDELCRRIKMKKYGETIIEKFGFGKDYTAGYSLVQLIETSSITAHFSEKWRRVYLNIFSCGEFDENKAEKFAIDFFKAGKSKRRILKR